MRGYTTEEVARMLGVTPAAVRYWIRKGKMRAVRDGERWIVPEGELEKLGAGGGGGGETREKSCANPEVWKAAALGILEAAAEFLRKNPWILEALGLRAGEEERKLAEAVIEMAKKYRPNSEELAEIFWTTLAEKMAEKASR